MQVGMALPSMVAGADRDVLLHWIRGVDEGPFSVLGVGERLGYPNQEMWTLLSAAAAVTERVRIESSVCVLPLHSAVLVAKQAATIDVISAGRFTLGVGVGGRDEDYCLAGAADTFADRFAQLDHQIDVVRRVWRGESIDGAAAVGPVPIQAGGPPILTASMGPKSMARSAHWADGIAGFDLAPSAESVASTFARFDDAWQAAGRAGVPYRQTSFWFGLTDDARQRVRAYATRYLSIFGDQAAQAMAASCCATDGTAVRDALKRLEDAGCDEVILVATTHDLADLDRAAEVVGAL